MGRGVEGGGWGGAGRAGGFKRQQIPKPRLTIKGNGVRTIPPRAEDYAQIETHLPLLLICLQVSPVN